jgi:hypothetical protein
MIKNLPYWKRQVRYNTMYNWKGEKTVTGKRGNSKVYYGVNHRFCIPHLVAKSPGIFLGIQCETVSFWSIPFRGRVWKQLICLFRK